MISLKSKTLCDYYSNNPNEYYIKFIHHNIDIKEESLTEYKNLEEDLKKIYGSTDIENATNVTSITSSKSLHRVDSVEIYGRILEGEEIDFPISSSEKSWTIAGYTPGKL